MILENDIIVRQTEEGVIAVTQNGVTLKNIPESVYLYLSSPNLDFLSLISSITGGSESTLIGEVDAQKD